jgi:DNA-binding NtrC family response regulator
MKQRIEALLVYTDEEPVQSLSQALEKLEVVTQRAHTCQQARNLLAATARPPDVVFTDTTLPDGSWRELLAIGREMQVPSKIVVVARTLDPRLYVDAMEHGAFDFMLAPFANEDLAHVIRCATDKRTHALSFGAA